ncbi:MAG: hypothetical protein KME28_15995 [Pelatocladus maniniholoensis HA4357-MV3]|jgi:hypothetical protein|uniref:Uncharacterized protein n=1 Tax=Pelatocladus maniniholoensis HA4357-MV3 TaxID=1117104 RepID=A0A9E3HAI1_9NOST|nr:hypothetical protein [Pelatocladus maniniholoensis HA4357-MV3]
MANSNPSPKTRFITERSEPLTEKLTLRMTASMYSQLLQQEDYREFIREAIANEFKRRGLDRPSV